MIMRRLVCIAALLLAVQPAVFAQGWTMVDALSPAVSQPGPMREAGVLVNQMQILHGNRLVIGKFNDRLTYRGMSVAAKGGGLFVLKLDADGNPLSIKSFQIGDSIATGTMLMDKHENIYMYGNVRPGVATEIGYTNPYPDKNVAILMKFSNDASGGISLQWVKEIMHISAEDTRNCEFNGMTIDDSGNLYLYGRAGVQYNKTRFPIPTFKMPTDSVVSAKTEIENIRKAQATIPIKPINYREGQYAELYNNKTNLKELNRLYNTYPDKSVWASNLYGMWFATAMLLNADYNNDSLTKYNIEALCGNHPDMMKWVNTRRRFNQSVSDSLEKYASQYQKTFCSTVTVGDSVYFTPINMVKVVICMESSTGNFKWSNGFPAILESYKYTDGNGGFYMRPVQWAVSGYLRDALYFDGSLFIVGNNDGYVADGKRYSAMRPYKNKGKGELNMVANPGSDLILMRMNAQTGRVEWAQTGGGRGGDDTYMKIARHDNFIFALGVVDPGDNAVALGDATGSNAAKDGVMLDSVVDMSSNFIVSQDAGKKLSSRFAENGSKGVIFAKYNTEGRLIEKSFLPGMDLPTDCEVNGEKEIVAMVSKIAAGQKIGFNADTVMYAQGGMGVLIYDMKGNPIKMLPMRDSMYASSSVKFFIDDDEQLYVGGRSFSAEVVFNDTIHLKNSNYHDRSYYEAPDYMAAYTPLSGRAEFYVYHGGHFGYLAKASTGFSPAFTQVEHVKCYGNNTGSLTVTPYFARGRCSYRWYKLETTGFEPYNPAFDTLNNVQGLAAGRYRVEVSDGHSTKVLEHEITQPLDIELTPNSSDATKWCAPDGTASISASGGAGGFTYFWTTQNGLIQANEVNDPNITALMQGHYDVVVVDRNGCKKSKTIEIQSNHNKFELNPVVEHIGSGGTINLNANGSMLTYQWEGPSGSFTPSNPSMADGLTEAGRYTVTVTDDKGCSESREFQLIDESKLYVDVMHKEDVKCKGEATGIIRLVEHNYQGTITTEWVKDGITITPPTLESSGYYKNLAAGEYKITVRDNVASYELTISINEPAEVLTVRDSIIPVRCYGYSDGQIILNVKGGTAPYTFAWNHANTQTQSTNQTVNNLPPADDYMVVVTDANGCSQTLSNIEVTMPDDISFSEPQICPISCYGANDGAFELDYSTIVGGNGGYWHIWSNTLMANEIHGLRPETYGLTLYDQKGCTKTWTRPLGAPTALNIEVDQQAGGIVQPLCAEMANGAIYSQVTGGSGSAYTYRWTGTMPITVADTFPNLIGVPPGTYMLSVTNASGCTQEQPFTLTAQHPTPSVFFDMSTSEMCTGESVTLTAQGAYMYDYALGESIVSASTIDETIDLIVNEADTFVVKVQGTDEHGCKGSSSQPLVVHRTPAVKIAADILTWCPSTPISTQLSMVGATKLDSTFARLWLAGTDTLARDKMSVEAQAEGIYILQVKNKGCVGTDTVRVSRLGAEQVKLATTDTTQWCFGDGSVVEFEASPANVSYRWYRNGEPVLLGVNAQPHTGTGLITNIPGEYHVTVEAGGNCATRSDTIVLQVHHPMMQLPADTVFIAPGILLTDTIPSSGDGLTWRWNDQPGDSIVQYDARSASIGDVLTYDVVLTDAHGCQVSGQVVLKVGATTGVASVSLGRLVLYPNPTHSGFYVEPAASDRQLWLYGVGGQLVHQQPLSGKTWVDTSRLPAGLYVVRTETAAAKVVVE